MYEIKGRMVWLLPANHCPGAAMILVRSPDNRYILHTGDFRFRPKMIDELKIIQGPDQPIKIDFVYMDNTFGTSDEAFPSQ
jgi:DNA cross-link repair 1A protein